MEKIGIILSATENGNYPIKKNMVFNQMCFSDAAYHHIGIHTCNLLHAL